MTYEIDVCDSVHGDTDLENRIQNAVNTALQLEQVQSAVLSVTIVDNATIHRLNREHLQHDYPTDVISFPLEWDCDQASLDDRQLQPDKRAAGASIEGEIVASLEYASQLAERFDWSVHDELTLYVVHGMLHICGYDDLSASEKKLMRAREIAILKALQLDVRYPDDQPVDDDEPPGESAV